jgi:uncharacterized protein (TIGR03382 family)
MATPRIRRIKFGHFDTLRRMMRSIVRNSFFVAIGFAAWSASLLQPARACSLSPQTEHTLDPGEETADTTAPGAPVLGALRVSRQPSLPGCQDSGACDGTGLISFAITAPADDRTPGAEMGYRLELASNVPNVFPPDETVRVDSEGRIYIYFNDQDQALDFTLSVRAVDLGGNVGEPATIEVSHEGGVGCLDDGNPPAPAPGEGGGCSAAGSSPGALVLASMALALVVRRRRIAIETPRTSGRLRG